MGSVSDGGGHRSPGVLDVDPASSRVVADLRHPHLTAMKSVPDERRVEPELASGCSLSELQQAIELPLRISLRILLDVLSGNSALSIRADEAEESWRVLTPVLNGWSRDLAPLQEYDAGSSGPV